MQERPSVCNGAMAQVANKCTTGADQEEVGVEKPRLVFAQTSFESLGPTVAVPQKLFACRVQRDRRVGVTDLGLERHKWDAVYEEDDVRDDASRRGDTHSSPLAFP